jgi:AcrR family transcriptional regulator
MPQAQKEYERRARFLMLSAHCYDSRDLMKRRANEKAGAPDVSRRDQILEIAAQLFALKGYRGTSMRDIGQRAGVLGGSLYYHIKSKDALFVEIHDAALDAASVRISAAVAAESDPWDRLEAAATTLLEIQLDPKSLTLPMMKDFREVPPGVRRQLIKGRDRFEKQFRALVENLPLPASFDRSLYRILLLALLNTAADWYRAGRLGPREIARETMRIFTHTASDRT